MIAKTFAQCAKKKRRNLFEAETGTQKGSIKRIKSNEVRQAKRTTLNEHSRKIDTIRRSKTAEGSIFRGVKVAVLKSFAATLRSMGLDENITTKEVVEQVIKPATLAKKCRYCDLIRCNGKLQSIGRAQAFISHCWGGLFKDLVASIVYTLGNDDAYVWIDIFAVLQHESPEQAADLNFEPVICACKGVVLCVPHLQSIADWDASIADKLKCPFYRVWCLVELTVAQTNQIPIIMIVGKAIKDGGFKPNACMMNALYSTVDIRRAQATFPADREMIFNSKLPAILDSHDADLCFKRVNQIAKGAINGTGFGGILDYPELTRAVFGELSCLMLFPKQHKQQLLFASSATGLLGPMRALIADGLDVNCECVSGFGSRGPRPLMVAAAGGHIQAMELLLNARADINLANIRDGWTPLMNAAEGNLVQTTKYLLDKGALASLCNKKGQTALSMTKSPRLRVLLKAAVTKESQNLVQHGERF